MSYKKATTHNWPRCHCGKVLCDSETDARRKAAMVQFLTGKVEAVDYHKCRTVPGVWHWTNPGIDPRCPCGQEPFSQAFVDKETQRINRGRAGERVQAKAYQCAHGGYHWLWYEAGRKFRYCPPCDAPAYPDPHSATLVAAYHERATGLQHRVWKCAVGRWHLAQGVDDCTAIGSHQGESQWVPYRGDTQRWWPCCGEVDVSL